MATTECKVAAQLIRENMNEMECFLSTLDPYSDSFEQLSLYQWTASELISLLIAKNASNAEKIIEDFRARMDEFSTRNYHTSRNFSIAYDAATHILDLILNGLPLEDY